MVAALEAMAVDGGLGGAAGPESLWFSLQLLLATVMGNNNVLSACLAMPVAIPTDAGPPLIFQELLLRAFSTSSRSCLAGAEREEVDADHASANSPDSIFSGLLGALKLLIYCLANSSTLLQSFACSPVTIPLTMDLTSFGGGGPFFTLQIQGLACLAMGLCITAPQGEVDVTSLMALLSRRVGIESFQQKVERLWRSEALQRPARSLTDFRWYNGVFRTFVRQQQRAVQRRMVQLYVAEGAGASGALNEDVADHYKQLIRVQDSELREVRHENEQLRAEVEAFMRRSLQASSTALADKADMLEQENEALRTEVEQIQAEMNTRVGRLKHERRLLQANVLELELQLQSMVVGYGQVEQSNAELRAALSAASPSSPGAVDNSVSRRIEDLETERGELLAALGCLVSKFPEALHFVAPLGSVIGAPISAAKVAFSGTA